jgi:hypothetical protein
VNTDAALAAAYSIEPIHERILQAALLRDGQAAKRWRAIREEIDLDTFWDNRALNFLPLVYRALVDEGADDPDLPRLRGVHRKVWYDNQLRFRTIAPALHALAAGGVDAVALKGTALATSTYADMGLRPMRDCDLLVRPGQIGRALRALELAGWTPNQTLPQNYAVHAQEIDVRGDEGGFIDLHWHIAQWLVSADDPWNSDEPFWARSLVIDVAGAPVRALDPTDSLLHAIVHGARHGWRDAPQWVADSVTISQSGATVDWDRIADVALACGIAMPVRHALVYLADRFTVDVPMSVTGRLDVSTSSRSRRMFASAGRGHDATPLERRLLGRSLAGTYRFWITESAPRSRRDALVAFPGWLADHWRLGHWSGIPAAAAVRAARRLSTRPAP